MDKKINKEWRDIAGYEGRYKISNCGDVFGVYRKKIMKPTLDKDGYKRISLYIHNGKYNHVFVHTLVLEAFICDRPQNMVCNHIDENKTNNRLDNLEWVTHKKNTQHSYYPGSKSYKNMERLSKYQYKLSLIHI